MHIGIPSQFTKVHDEWIRPAPRIISVIRVRASRGNDSAVFHLHVGMPTQFRRVRDHWTRRNRASSASSGSRLPHNMIPQSVPHQHHPGQGRASPHKDSFVVHLQGIPSQFTRRVMIGPVGIIRVRASPPNVSEVFHKYMHIRVNLQGYLMSGSARNCASSASSGSGLAQAMILQFFICKGIPS